MEGKIFSFDLQRFTLAWSIGGSSGGNPDLSSYTDKFIFGIGVDSVASLQVGEESSSKFWSLAGGKASSLISLDLNATTNSAVKAINDSITGLDYKTFDASKVTESTFYFKLASNTPFTSIAGASSTANTIDASAVTNGNLSITGGTDADLLKAGKSGTFYLNGGTSGADTLVGGNGVDFFIFDGGNSHTASIQSYETKDFISLTGDAALPLANSVVAVGSNDLALYFGTNGANSLLVEGAKGSVVNVITSSGNATYHYSEDFIATNDYKNVSLTAGASSLDATKGNFSGKTVSIDATGSTVDDGVKITLNSRGDSVIGSSKGNSITGGTGADFISVSGGGSDLFYYTGGGADSIVGLSTGDSVSLAKGFNLVTDGNKLVSLAGDGGSKFQLFLDDKNANSLTFSISSGAVSVYSGTSHLEYTPTAISLASGSAASVTLGSSYNLIGSSLDGSSFTFIDASAVSVASTFSIQGGASASDIYGSDNVVTSIVGGSTNMDTLRAGTAGAILNGGASGGDLLIGNSGKDTFLYVGGANSIKSYTYSTVEADADVVSLTGTGLDIPMTFDTTKSAHADYNGSDYVVSLGSGSSITFTTTDRFALKTSDSIYTYAPGSIALAVNGTDKGITIGGDDYTAKTFNGASDANEGFESISASEVQRAIKVTGNDKNNYMLASSLHGGTLLGGVGEDTLQAGSVGAYMDGGDGNVLYIGSGDSVNSIGADTFVYRGGTASIQNYGAFDVVNFSARDITITDATISAQSVGTAEDTKYNISLNWGGNNDAIIFQSLTGTMASVSGVSLQSGRNNLYVYNNDRVTWNGKSVTLTADYAGASIGTEQAASLYTAPNDTLLATIDAHLVGQSISGDTTVFTIAGNDNANYIIGSTLRANSISGGGGDDTLVGSTDTTKADVFHYTAGNDVIIGFDSNDNLSISSGLRDSIAKAKAGRNSLTFTIDKDKSIAFRAGDNTDVPEIVSLSGDGNGYLTASGVVSSISGNTDGAYSLRLFSSAKGTINLDDDIYGKQTITSINAASVSNGLTILAKNVTDSVVSYNFASNNKKRDTFEYGGGTVSITGFESGKDRLNLGDYAIGAFSINGGDANTKGDVLISLTSGNTQGVVSLGAAQSNEILIRQNGARSYSKMVFKESGVLENKAKNPTSATVSANATAYHADNVKKINVRTTDNAVSIYAGAKGSVVDASNAGASVSLISNAKTDRFTSSNYSDVFFFNTSNGGKDIFNGFVGGTASTSDSIAFGEDGTGSASLLSGAKITANNKAVKFKFGKNTLTVKGDSIKDAKLQIAGTAYSYSKNAIINDTAASLTSEFGGTYKLDGVSNVDGQLVKKNLTFKGSSANETLTGGTKKTTFKGGGGTDSLVGGSGNDVFFYAKGDNGTAHIADFDLENDKLKIAGGTLRKIDTVSGGGLTFDMSAKNNKDDPAIGHFVIDSFATYDSKGKKSETTSNKNGTISEADAKKTLFHAGNTYYWFAQQDVTAEVTTEGGDGTTTTIVAQTGDLITWSDKKVSSSDAKNYAVIELNYGTNLVKSGVATMVSSKDQGATLPTTT